MPKNKISLFNACPAFRPKIPELLNRWEVSINAMGAIYATAFVSGYQGFGNKLVMQIGAVSSMVLTPLVLMVYVHDKVDKEKINDALNTSSVFNFNIIVFSHILALVIRKKYVSDWMFAYPASAASFFSLVYLFTLPEKGKPSIHRALLHGVPTFITQWSSFDTLFSGPINAMGNTAVVPPVERVVRLSIAAACAVPRGAASFFSHRYDTLKISRPKWLMHEEAFSRGVSTLSHAFNLSAMWIHFITQEDDAWLAIAPMVILLFNLLYSFFNLPDAVDVYESITEDGEGDGLIESPRGSV